MHRQRAKPSPRRRKQDILSFQSTLTDCACESVALIVHVDVNAHGDAGEHVSAVVTLTMGIHESIIPWWSTVTLPHLFLMSPHVH